MKEIGTLARALAFHVVGGEDSSSRPPKGIPKDFVRLVQRSGRQYESQFRAAAQRLLEVTENHPETNLHCLFQHTFRDGGCNWGRIAAVYAFAATLGQEARPSREKVAEATGDFVADHLSKWIEDRGGWKESGTSRSRVFRMADLLAAALSGAATCLELFFR